MLDGLTLPIVAAVLLGIAYLLYKAVRHGRK